MFQKVISHVDPFQKHIHMAQDELLGQNKWGVERFGLMFPSSNELFRDRFLFLRTANALPGQTGRSCPLGWVSSYLLGKD